ncbi:MAG: hypothetical protein K2X93_24840 [Candidatus Obscuribacterales bacterium]|nr:hypothetical protein [Candidatus Obscuribacterales bacterium]
MSRPLLICLALWLFASALPVSAQSRLVERPKKELFVAMRLSDLSDETRLLAEQLEIMSALTELYENNMPLAPQRKKFLRTKVLETILECYFDAASVQAEADREQGVLEAQQDRMTARRDRSVEYNNATNFIASGTLNTIGSVLGFSNDAPALPGNLNQMLSGVVSASMSTYSLKQQGGGRSRAQGHPTVLAELFGRPTDKDTSYPESVWRFFHAKPQGQPQSRVQTLEKQWIERGHLEPRGSKREIQKLDIVCGVANNRKVISIDDLQDAISMIADVSTVAELMTFHLRDLLRMIDSDVIPGYAQTDNETGD